VGRGRGRRRLEDGMILALIQAMDRLIIFGVLEVESEVRSAGDHENKRGCAWEHIRYEMSGYMKT
jgi:hypothetical protein